MESRSCVGAWVLLIGLVPPRRSASARGGGLLLVGDEAGSGGEREAPLLLADQLDDAEGDVGAVALDRLRTEEVSDGDVVERAAAVPHFHDVRLDGRVEDKGYAFQKLRLVVPAAGVVLERRGLQALGLVAHAGRCRVRQERQEVAPDAIARERTAVVAVVAAGLVADRRLHEGLDVLGERVGSGRHWGFSLSLMPSRLRSASVTEASSVPRVRERKNVPYTRW